MKLCYNIRYYFNRIPEQKGVWLMAINRATIIKASSDTDYRRGQDIFLIDKRITDFEIDVNPLTNTPMITANVSDADGSSHEVEISIDEDAYQIIGSHCSCPDFYHSDKLCRHCVAALLKYISHAASSVKPFLLCRTH